LERVQDISNHDGDQEYKINYTYTLRPKFVGETRMSSYCKQTE